MKRILITGANRGVGLELVLQYAMNGAQVFAGCRSPEKAATLEDVSTKYPGQITILPLDVTDEESIIQSAALVAEKTKGLDILFNNAAIFMDGENIKNFDAKDALHMLNVNAIGPILVVKHFIDHLKAGDQPRVVNVSSEAGSISQMTSFRGYYYYGSKALLNMFTRDLACDPAAKNIIVTMIHPGWVRTDMGGPEAHLSPAQSAAGLIKVTEGLTLDDNGKFFTWEGVEYPW